MTSYQSSVKMLRETLWNRPGSGVSVMVGSGFSRSANKTRFDVDDIPLWNDIASAVAGILYPELENGSGNGLTYPVPTAESALRLGQEFETVFGRAKLHEFLDEVIHDKDFAPGKPHTRLLSLPWRDVFTTNWDKLLERAASDLVKRSYSLVQNVHQLPLKSQPRIFKLHGSLTAQFPLVFTEEDYRTYPIRFAPFVNSVQQAMMESLFLLIGFSGDDPNFLKWSGWIRDNLGDASPKIYLAGWLKLSPSRRRMLEDSGIIPIDIAEHPNAGNWPEGLRHQFSTDWLLHSLEKGQPYDSTNWPSSRMPETEPVPNYLEPVDLVDVDVPMAQPAKESGASSPDCENELLERVNQVLVAWAHNRKLYPGWLGLPHGQVRFDLSSRTNEWEPQILNLLSRLSPVERLNAIRELVWRRETLLEPISSELEAAAQESLDAIDCTNRIIEDGFESRDDWIEIRDAWRAVSLALVTDARYECKLGLFERRLKALSPLLNENPDAKHRALQERCLWAAYSLDLEQLNELLNGWHVESCDPAWMLRKAALLTEAMRYEESRRLVQEALDLLRKSSQSEKNIANASRESWTLASSLSFSNRESLPREWDKLAAQKCDALAEVDFIRRALQGIEEQVEAPSFDTSLVEGFSIEISNRGYERLISVYRAVRLPEVTGLPIRNNPDNDGLPATSLFSDVLKLAAERLVTDKPDLALRLALRVYASDSDKSLKRLLSRARVASLPGETVKTISGLCIMVINRNLPHFSTPSDPMAGMSLVEGLRVALEVLSRLAPRLPPGQLDSVLDIALLCCKSSEVAGHHWLTSPVRRLLVRSWQSLSNKGRRNRVIELLNAPIIGFEGFSDNTNFPDPGALADSQDIPAKDVLDASPKFRQVVSFLIRAAGESGTVQMRAIARLDPLIASRSLTVSETHEVATALWEDSDPILNDQRGNNHIPNWLYLMLPELEEGRAEQSFRCKWLTPNTENQSDKREYAIDVLAQVSAAVAELERIGKSFALSMDEQQHIVAQLGPLTELNTTSPVSLNFSQRYSNRQVSSLIVRIRIPEDVAEELIERVEVLLRADLPMRNPWSRPLADQRIGLGYALIPGLARALPNQLDTVSLWLTNGLGSDDNSRASGAILALHSWLFASARSEMQPIPEDLIREVGTIIALGHKAALADSLVLARNVFEKGLSFQQETIGSFALRGLSYLSQVLKYDPDQGQYTDVYRLRISCIELAVTMAGHGFENDDAIARWLEIGRNDPFSEIRNIVAESDLVG